MSITDPTPFIDQVQGGPVAVLIGPPGLPGIVLGNWIGHIQAVNSFLQVVQVALAVEFWVVVADNDQTLIHICIMPFPQRGKRSLAVNSTKGPHIQQDHLSSQISQPQGAFAIEPDIVGQLRGLAEIGKVRS